MEISTTITVRGNSVIANKIDGAWRFNVLLKMPIGSFLLPHEIKALADDIKSLIERIEKIDAGEERLSSGETWSTATFSTCNHDERVRVSIPKRFLGTRTINVCKQCGQYENEA